MDDYSGSGKLIRYSFYSLSRFLMKQKKSRLLSFVWVILILSFIVFTSTSYAGNGDDLVEAAHTGNLSKVRALLKKETDVDHENSVGATALIIASQEGHEAIVQILLDKGAEVNVRENGGRTALKFAKTQKIKTLLKAAGASE